MSQSQSRGLIARCGHDCFEFDRGQPSEADLAAAVVGAFDPGDDRDAEFLSGVPARAVQDGLLQQREEALHGGVVPGGPDPAHGSDHVVATQGENESPASKLTSPVAVNQAAGDIATAAHRICRRTASRVGGGTA